MPERYERPYREVRDYYRSLIGNFVEVYTKCSLDECAKRDVKGLYQKAMRGEIKGFTGVDDPYEEPLHAEVICETDKETPEQSADKVWQKLEELGYLSKSEAAAKRA